MTSTTAIPSMMQSSNCFIRWFRGEIQLWKSVLLLQMFGTYGLLFALESSKILLPETISVVIKIIALPIFALYSSICVFRAAPNFRTTIRGTVAKCWAVTFVLWAFCVAYALSITITG
ncbi:MAG TPA: hypothetical protein DCS35_11930 [Vibrio sp.]|nr:hypothetical protein [Vibrio sp.]